MEFVGSSSPKLAIWQQSICPISNDWCKGFLYTYLHHGWSFVNFRFFLFLFQDSCNSRPTSHRSLVVLRNTLGSNSPVGTDADSWSGSLLHDGRSGWDHRWRSVLPQLAEWISETATFRSRWDVCGWTQSLQTSRCRADYVSEGLWGKTTNYMYPPQRKHIKTVCIFSAKCVQTCWMETPSITTNLRVDTFAGLFSDQSNSATTSSGRVRTPCISSADGRHRIAKVSFRRQLVENGYYQELRLGPHIIYPAIISL